MPQYEEHLLIKVAEYYYINNLTQQQIASKMNTSRVKVSRLLSKAKKMGLVEIRIKYPTNRNIQIEKKLEDIFNLKEALVVSSDYESKDLTINGVARFTSRYLIENIRDGDVLGISWGRTLKKIASFIEYSGKKIEIVQMLGNTTPNDVSGNEIVRKFSKAFISRYYLLPAPAIVDNEKLKNMLMLDSKIIEIFKKLNSVTFAIISIGNLDKESTFVSSGYLNNNDLKILAESKAIGDYCGIFFDKYGNICNTLVNKRVIGIEFEKLRKIPNVIGVSSGPEKAQAILGALRTGGIDILITDKSTALEVISKSNE